MTSGSNYLSRDGYEELRKKLEFLKTKKRRELAKAVGVARAHGDISENAEYEAAKEAQGFNEKRVAELEEKLSNAQILDDANIDKNKVFIGATVKLEDLNSKRELEYMLVSELEADYAAGKISITSPVGKGLLGHKKGEVVKIKVPARTLEYKILEISR